MLLHVAALSSLCTPPLNICVFEYEKDLGNPAHEVIHQSPKSPSVSRICHAPALIFGCYCHISPRSPTDYCLADREPVSSQRQNRRWWDLVEVLCCPTLPCFDYLTPLEVTCHHCKIKWWSNQASLSYFRQAGMSSSLLAWQNFSTQASVQADAHCSIEWLLECCGEWLASLHSHSICTHP